MDEELVDIVDISGRPKKKALKSEAHKHGWLHKTVIGYLRYGDDWALVRQASDKQDAGQLVAPVGGHVKAGETEIEALMREVEEEIGVKNITYSRVGDAIFHRQVVGRDENHMFIVYEITTSEPIKLSEEATDIKTFTKTELKQSLKDNPKHFGDGYYFVLENFYPEYLPKSWVKKWT